MLCEARTFLRAGKAAPPPYVPLVFPALSVREYRNNLAASFTKADNGEQVLIRRKNEIYALVKVGREDLMITPELQARIDKAREEIKSGKCVTLKSSEDIDAYFDSL